MVGIIIDEILSVHGCHNPRRAVPRGIVGKNGIATRVVGIDGAGRINPVGAIIGVGLGGIILTQGIIMVVATRSANPCFVHPSEKGLLSQS